MNIWIDTEFTHFVAPSLISLAMIAETGEEFYAESKDWRLENCSTFVKEEVLPKLQGPRQSLKNLAAGAEAWISSRGPGLTFITDSAIDLLVLATTLPTGFPGGSKFQVLDVSGVTGIAHTFHHHALHDARWLKSASLSGQHIPVLADHL